MSTLSNLFLQSARMYSSLADAVFGDSVNWSQFASSVSNMRMQTAKTIMGTPLDITVELGEDTDVLSGEPNWQSCLALDNLLMREMAQYEDQLLPLLMGVYTAAHRGAAYASSIDDRPKYKQCLGCGAVNETWQCPICGNGRNWLVGVEVPENTEKVEPENTMPNFTFGDFPPEKPVQPKKWEVLLGEQEADIFKATGLVKPTLG